MTTTTLQAYVGKRMLLTIKEGGYGQPPVEEYKIIELSPSEQWVKLMNLYGRKFWKPVTSVAVVEELKPLRTEPVPASN